jgi:hypothetical protein
MPSRPKRGGTRGSARPSKSRSKKPRARARPKTAARPAARPAAKPVAAKPAPAAVASAPAAGPGVGADDRHHVLSLAFLRDGDEFLARMETDGGQITELKNRSLDQLLTLVANELEDLLE